MRLDIFLVQKNLAASRTQAQDFVANGYVVLQTGNKKQILNKASFEVNDENSEFISVENNPLQKYVSRAGIKLETALQRLNIGVINRTALDIGQSTGGFSDALLQAGAKRVVGVDVGHSQLHDKLKADPRLVCIENLNVKDLAQHAEFLATVAEYQFDLLVMDVSFISVTKVIPHIAPFLAAGGEYLILVKPQYECGQENLDKSGIVKNKNVYARIEIQVKECALHYFKNVEAYIESALPGKDGNQEYFIYGKKVN